MTEHQNWTCRLVQLSHFNLTKLFNDHILCLLSIYWTFKFHFPPAWSLKQAFFSFWVSVESLLRFLVLYINHSYVMENFKKSGEIKSKLRKIYPNNHENFKSTNSKSRVQLLALKECTIIVITIGALCQSSWIFQCNGFRKWL